MSLIWHHNEVMAEKEKSIESIQEKMASLKQKNQIQTKGIQQLNETNVCIERKMDVMTVKRDSLERKINDLNQQNVSLKAQIVMIREETQNNEEKVESAQIEALKIEIASLKQKNLIETKEIQQERDALKKQIQDKDEKLQRVETMIEQSIESIQDTPFDSISRIVLRRKLF